MILKWIFDRSVAFVGLVLLLPLLVITVVAIKIESPSLPTLFLQERVGYKGCLFMIVKFRSMNMDKEVGLVGSWLRKCHLDELPQLWNVLIGDMSFVGPRPDVPGYADKLTGDDRDVLKLRPGITGPATLKYRSENEMIVEWVREMKSEDLRMKDGIPIGLSEQELALWYNDNVIYPDKVRLNCYYYRHYSFIKDIQMMICTVLGKKMEYAGEII